MSDVVREILLCLFLAALLGMAIGWLARGLRARRLATAEASASRRAMEEVQARLRVIESARAADQRNLEEVRMAGESADRLGETLRRELRETEMARDTARHEASGTRDQLAKLSARLREIETARDAAKAEADAAGAAVTAAPARRAEVEALRDAGRRDGEQLRAGQVSPSPAEEASRQRFETLRATLKAAENGWDSARAQADAALQQLGATRTHLTESEADRNALAEKVVEIQALLLEFRSRLDVPETPVAEPPGHGPVSSDETALGPAAGRRAKPVRDDLQKIRGIGPVVERTLHRAGIYRYAQIAIWTREDILSMGARLPGFPDRIVRDRWTATARRLHIAKYGSPP
jgi:predicted flap endonuclease-1-like 5' DNA nuclease